MLDSQGVSKVQVPLSRCWRYVSCRQTYSCWMFCRRGLWKISKISGSLKIDSCLVLKECLSRRILRFKTSAIDLIHFERVSASMYSFLAHRLAYSSHASIKMPKLCCHEYDTGNLYFGSMRKRSLSLKSRTTLRSTVTMWPHGTYINCASEQLQGGRSCERPWKSNCCKHAL